MIWQDFNEFREEQLAALAPEEIAPDLGPCCACKGTRAVRNIIALPFEGPVPGTGWGCVQCGLPANGAVAVVCDECLESNAERVEICYGYPGDKGRTPMPAEASRIAFDHDLSKHPEIRGEEAKCRVCGCTDERACPGGCYWVEPDLCSRCTDIRRV